MVVLPPPYPQSSDRRRNNNVPGASSAATPSSSSAPVPHFDSILRAAPAFDEDDDDFDDNDDDLAETLSSSSSSLVGGGEEAAPGWLASKIAPHAELHTALHAYLDANSRLEEQIHQMQENIHIDAGKIKSTASKATRLERQLDTLRLEGEKGKKKMIFWTPKRRREWRQKMMETQAEWEPTVVQLRQAEEALLLDREKLGNLQDELVDYKKIESRLDSIDDEIFRGLTASHHHQDQGGEADEEEEDELEQQYHILLHTQRRLRASVKMEERAQTHLSKAFQLCQALNKELLAGLNIGIEIGVPSNLKHKHGLWKGTSPIHSANRARGHVLRAKTLCGDLHTHYILARGVQRRIAVITKLHVIELNRLPGMNARNAVDEIGLHRSLEQSYAQAKIAKSHIENQSRLSRQRQEKLKGHIKDLTRESKSTWLQLRQVRRRIVAEESPAPIAHSRSNSHLLHPHNGEEGLPPYKRNLISSSVVGLASSTNTNTTEDAPFSRLEISLPHAFRKRVDRESITRCKDLVLRVAIEVGGVQLDDDKLPGENGEENNNAAQHEIEEEDLPGLELCFGR